MPESSPSVLIIRLDALGDALALAPLLAALHARKIPVDLVLTPANAGVFTPRAVRRIVRAGFDLRSNAAANLRAIDALGNELAPADYSHALVATEDPSGYRLARAVAAPVRVGFTNGWGKPLKTLWTRSFLSQSVYRSAGLDPRGRHECEVLFSLAACLLGAARPTHDPARLRPLVIEHEPERDARIAVQITDKWERLGIAFDAVLEMLRCIGGDGALHLIAAAREASYADAIERATGLAVERFAALEPWKATIAAARAVIAPDSGAVHVAGMTGTPTVAVFPPQPNFALQVARWAPWAAPHRVVKADAGWPLRAADALATLL